jgi:hypothetical protein
MASSRQRRGRLHVSDVALEVLAILSGLAGAAIIVGYFLGLWK